MPACRVRTLTLVLALCGCGQSRAEEPATPDQATVPLLVEGNRPYVDLTFRRPDGSPRKARFVVDSGGGGFIVTEPLARDLGLAWGDTMREDGMDVAQATSAPRASVGEFPLELDPKRVVVVLGKESIVPPVAPGHAEGLLPGHVLSRYHVVFDYPERTFSIARVGVLKPRGDALPMPVSKRSGFPRTEIEIDGVTRGFLVDTGASFTMVSEVLVKAWGAAHPDWERHPGAFGDAKTLGGMTLETMFVPSARWGPRTLGRFGVVSQREGTFERRMSSLMTSPIAGSLAGNVLKGLRVELDYPHETLYLSAP
jgi:hypothetical protein